MIPWAVITISAVVTASDRQSLKRRLLAAPLLVAGVRVSVAAAAFSGAYVCGYAAAVEAAAQHDEHFFARRLSQGNWCTFNDILLPSFQAYHGWQSGAYAGLPAHAWNETYACELLHKKGATFSTGWWEHRPSRIPMPENGQFPILARQDRSVVLEGDEIEDADLKWLHLLGEFDRVEINCPHVTVSGINYLRKIHPYMFQVREVWWRSGQPLPELAKMNQEGPNKIKIGPKKKPREVGR